ncbi:MAG: Outer rane vitamin receptor BtuB [Myxococcaceae bacterium]|nr:Outer rane vitamin receptor BtuB [Myxococcaceae bacterium]
MRRVRTTALLAALALPAAASAQTPPPADEPTIGEATVSAPARREESLMETPRAVSVDGRRDAARALARDLGDRLEEMPGVFLQRTTTASAAPLIRGLGGQRTLLLFDGFRLNDSLTKVGGNALLSLVDPASVRRLEVVRGPASVMYGSDALGGVVLAVPIDATPRADRGDHAYGELSTRVATAESSLTAQGLAEGESGRFGLMASGTVGTLGPITAGGDLGGQPFTGHGDRAFTVRAMVDPGRGHALGVGYQTSAITNAPRPDTSLPDDRRVFRLQLRDVVSARWTVRRGDLAASARAGFIRRVEDRDRYRPDRLDIEHDEVLTPQVTAQLAWTTPRGTLTAGLDLAADRVTSTTDTVRPGRPTERSRGRYLDGSSYLTGGAFAHYALRLASRRVLIEAGARASLTTLDSPVDQGFAAYRRQYAAPVASVGARWLVARGFALLANVLGGFRAPNLDDYQALGAGARSFDVPNPDLGPERSWTAELGARLARGPLEGSVFAYASTMSGLVTRVPSTFNGATMVDGRQVYTRMNASDARLAGAEFDLTVTARNGLYAAVSGSYTWAEATVAQGGASTTEALSKVPPAFGRVALGWRRATHWIDLVASGAFSQTRLSASDRDDLRLCPDGPTMCASVPGYVSFTARGGVRVHPQITMALAVENVLDAAFTPYGGGFPAAGTNVVLSLRGHSE